MIIYIIIIKDSRCEDMNTILEIIIAGLGVIVACLQVKLSMQINEQNISREKGYFIMEQTNIRKPDDDDYRRFIGLFQLKNDIRFRLYGNGDVFVLQKTIKVNGMIKENEEMLETFFSQFSQEAPLGFKLPLTSKDENSDRLDIEILFLLKNVTGYKYIERITLNFTKNDSDNIWILKKRNINFEKSKQLQKSIISS